MNRRLALVALWAAFAVASVGVGFGAAGLVGDPFTDGVDGATDAAPLTATATATGSATATPSGSPSRSASPRRSEEPSSSAQPSGSAEPTDPGSTSGAAVTRAITTRAGFVSATCRGGLVNVNASPDVGWEIHDIDEGRRREARVRFERRDGDDRVEVEATCGNDVPRFSLDDDGDDGDDRDDGDED